MTQPPYGPPPPGTPPPGWTPPPPPRRRQKPRVRWFVVAGVMIVAAPVIFAGALFTVLRPLTQEDAVLGAGQQVQVDLPAGEERAVFTDGPGPVGCTATDGSGADLPMRPVSGDFSYNEWTAAYRFDTGDGRVTLECSGSFADRFRVAQLPSTGGFVAGIVVGIVGPLLIGGAGLVLLVVLIVLYATGAPREPRPH